MIDRIVVPKSRRERRKLLEEAIGAGDRSVIRAIAEVDAELINSGNSHGNKRALSLALEFNPEIADLLFELGADINAVNHGGWSLLSGALYDGNREAAAWLIDKGVKVTCHDAAGLNDVKRLSAMIDADRKSISRLFRGRMPLHFAAWCDADETARLLIEQGASVDAPDKEGFTPLAHASRRGCAGAAAVLLSCGADPNVRGNYAGGTVLHRAVAEGHTSVVRLLLEHGAKPDAFDWAGKTPLHQAVCKNASLVEVILGFKPDLTARNKEGLTAYDLAQKRGNKTIISKLEIALAAGKQA